MLRARQDFASRDRARQGIYVESKALALLLRNCRLLGTLSAALSGFSFMGVASHLGKSATAPGNAPSEWLFAFTVLGVSTLGCALLSFIVATAAAIHAPGMALHGPNASSLHNAVDQLRRYFSVAAVLCAVAFALLCATLMVLIPIHGGAGGGSLGALAPAALLALVLSVGLWYMRRDSGFLHRAALQLRGSIPGVETRSLLVRSVLGTSSVSHRDRSTVL